MIFLFSIDYKQDFQPQRENKNIMLFGVTFWQHVATKYKLAVYKNII